MPIATEEGPFHVLTPFNSDRASIGCSLHAPEDLSALRNSAEGTSRGVSYRLEISSSIGLKGVSSAWTLTARAAPLVDCQDSPRAADNAYHG
jgi:hypothetical protein